MMTWSNMVAVGKKKRDRVEKGLDGEKNKEL